MKKKRGRYSEKKKSIIKVNISCVIVLILMALIYFYEVIPMLIKNDILFVICWILLVGGTILAFYIFVATIQWLILNKYESYENEKKLKEIKNQYSENKKNADQE